MIHDINNLRPHAINVFKGTYEYEGKKYTFEYEFEEGFTKEDIEFIFLEGNYSCACNISHLIREYCDKSFPALSCLDDNIRLIHYEIYSKVLIKCNE